MYVIEQSFQLFYQLFHSIFISSHLIFWSHLSLFILNNLNSLNLLSLFEKLSCAYFELSYNSSSSSFSDLFNSSNESSIHINSKVVRYSFSSINSSVVFISVVSTSSTSFIMFKSNLFFCENFNEKNDFSTSRWLTKIEWKITKDVNNDEISSKTFLKIIYLLVIKNAVVWIESNQKTFEILIKRNSTQTDVNTFCDLFQARFSAKIYEISSENYNQKLKDFHQTENESLFKYYSRMKTLIHKMKVKKKFSLSEIIFLNHIDLMILNIIFKAFLREFNDADIRKKITKDMNSSNKFLKSLYLLAEKIKITKAELDKLRKKEEKTKEFQLYKNYANDLLNKSKLTALLFEYTLSDNAITTSNHEDIINIISFNNRFLHASEKRFQSRFEINYYRRSNNRSFIDKSFMNRQSFNQFVFKSLFDRKTSSNSYINDEKMWSSANESLCVKCDEIEFKSNENHQCLLFSAWKNFYLRSIVFENSAQVFFVFYNYEQYDENLKLYDHHLFHRMIRFRSKDVETFSENSRVFISEFTVSFSDYAASSYESKSFFLSFSSNFLKSVSNIESFYDEKSSKRSHMNDSSQSIQDIVLQNERMSQFSSSSERITKKEKKRAERKTKMTSLIDMFNDILDTYDKIISIRDVLKKAKMNLTWMNFLTWFSIICKELKRVCIRVAKKRFSKSKIKQSNDQSMQSSQQSSFSNLSNFQWMSTQIVRSQQFQNYFTIEIFQMSVSSVVQQSISLQSFQSQLSQNLDQQDQQSQQVQISMKSFIVNSFTQKILKTSLKNKTMSFVETKIDERIEFLKELIKLKKAFRFSVIVILETVRVMLEKKIYSSESEFRNECDLIKNDSKIEINSSFIKKYRVSRFYHEDCWS